MEAIVLDYALPLTSSSGVRLGYARLATRSGRVLALRHEGVLGLGEAAPAWWAGDESLEAAREALSAAAIWLQRTVVDPVELDETARAGRAYPSGLESALARSRTARAAVQSALLDLRARRAWISVAESLGGNVAPCTVNVLITDEGRAGVVRSVRRALADGYRTAKLKVGTSDDAARIAAALDAASGRLSLRLDANRAWDFDQAVSLLSPLHDAPIEYVEEPLRDPSPAALARLRARIGTPIALDESIVDGVDLQRFAGGVDVAVFKPARLGGPHATMRMIGAARDLGVAITITDSLESCIGRALALHLACAARLEKRAVGLAGASLLGEDLSSESGFLRGPVIAPTGPGLLDPAALDRLALDSAFTRGRQQ